MFEARTFGAITLVAALMSGTASMALSTDEVWADWQAAMTAQGMTVSSATEVKDGADLRLNGVTMTSANGAKVTMAEVVLTEEADGHVSIKPMDISMVPSATGAKVEITQTGLVIGVYEDAGGMGYGIDADSLGVVFDDTVEGSATPAAASAKGSVLLGGLSGRYTREAGAAAIAMTASDVTYDIAQADPAAGLDQSQKSTTKNMALTGKLTIPDGIDLMTLETPEAFRAAALSGLGLMAEFSQDTSESDLTQNAPLPFSARIVGAAGTTSVTLGAAKAGVVGTVGKLSVAVKSAALPEEVTGSADGMTFDFSMPVVATDAPGDYTYKIGISNLVLADAGWALFDPTGALPRTPAELDIDAGGKLKIDLFDLMAASDAGTQPTFMPDLQTLDIRSLGLKLAGAVFSGSGAFTFDNSMVAAGGPPMPIGTASVKLEGGNKFIDALIAMGVMTADDAMGARMMMAMFGKSAGDDVLTSDIEAKAGGSIFVNGQQIQ